MPGTGVVLAPEWKREFMDINLANFKKQVVALAILGLVVVGTCAVRSVLHRNSATMADAHKVRSHCGRVRGGSPQEAPKQASTTIPERVYWGAAHNHTGYSFDAGMFGVTLGPDDLFKVATGGEVRSTTA